MRWERGPQRELRGQGLGRSPPRAYRDVMQPHPHPPRIVLLRPRGRGGVASVVDQVSAVLRAQIPATIVDVGRLPGERLGAGALVRDTRALRRVLAGASVLHLHPSLRSRAIVRDAVLHELAQRMGCPTVVQLHGFDRELAAWIEDQPLARRALQRSLLSADALLVLGQPFAQRLIRLGAPPDRIHVVDNPFDPAEIPTRRLGGSRMVLYLGRLVRGKGLPELIGALGLLSRRRPELRLVIAGQGPLQPALQAQARDQGIAERVWFAGWVEGAAKASLLARASVMALASRGEAAPVSVIEALAAGVPVVATRTGAIPELVGPAGVILDRADPRALAGALAEVLDDPDRGRLGPAQVARCTPEQVAGRWLQIYASIGVAIPGAPGGSPDPGELVPTERAAVLRRGAGA